MSNAKKKQKRKSRREAKRKEARRRDSVSPVKRLAAAHGEIECWMSDDFEGKRQSQMFVYKRAGLLMGVAAFLVDRGVVGLKDAWTAMNITRQQFEEVLEGSRGEGITMSRAKMEDVRKMVAGGFRWAYENGMRLPKDLDKTAALIGGVGDWRAADISRFAREFVGHPADLRQRLIGEAFESYIMRSDIAFTFSDLAKSNTGGTPLSPG